MRSSNPFEALLGLSWGALGAVLGRLGPILSRIGDQIGDQICEQTYLRVYSATMNITGVAGDTPRGVFDPVTPTSGRGRAVLDDKESV